MAETEPRIGTTGALSIPSLSDFPGKLPGFGGLLRPETQLYPPAVPPADLLARTTVEPDGACLTAATSIGAVTLRVAYRDEQIPEDQPGGWTMARFYSPLPPELAGHEGDKPLLRQRYPYAELGFGVHFGVIIDVPREAGLSEFSAPEHVGHRDISGFDVGTKFGVEVDYDERYDVTVQKRARAILFLALRNNGREPAYQTRYTDGFQTVYGETIFGRFRPSPNDPDLATMAVAHRRTEDDKDRHKKDAEADAQRLLLRRQNSDQSGPEEGLTTAIIYTATETRYDDVTVRRRDRPQPRLAIQALHDPFNPSSTKRTMVGGRVDYGRPTRVPISKPIKTSDPTPIGAFRFAIVGTDTLQAV